MNEWHPIETVPDDQVIIVGIWLHGEWRQTIRNRKHPRWEGYTHWIPLPDPPEAP